MLYTHTDKMPTICKIISRLLLETIFIPLGEDEKYYDEAVERTHCVEYGHTKPSFILVLPLSLRHEKTTSKPAFRIEKWRCSGKNELVTQGLFLYSP